MAFASTCPLERHYSKYGHASTVHGHAKKEGAGGHYTWGTPLDVTDFQTHATATPKVTVSSAPLPGSEQPYISSPASGLQTSLRDPKQFPTLLGYVTQPHAPEGAWRPVSAKVEDNHSGRVTGAVFDVSHPRSQFAKQPRHVYHQSLQGAIGGGVTDQDSKARIAVATAVPATGVTHGAKHDVHFAAPLNTLRAVQHNVQHHVVQQAPKHSLHDVQHKPRYMQMRVTQSGRGR